MAHDERSTTSPSWTLAEAPYDGDHLLTRLTAVITAWHVKPEDEGRVLRACAALRSALDRCPGGTFQARWLVFEQQVWPAWRAGHDRPASNHWSWGVRVVVLARLVRPGWGILGGSRIVQWVRGLTPDEPLRQEADHLQQAIAQVAWVSARKQEQALMLGLRLLLRQGYASVNQITEADLRALPRAVSHGTDILDAALCHLGAFHRTPQRGTSRHLRKARLSPAQLVAASDIPERFRPVTILYLESYATRVSDAYTTLRHKLLALGHFWCFLDEHYPDVGSCTEVLPLHGRAFVPYACDRARRHQRGPNPGTTDRLTAHAWLVNVRTFFADICTWGTEPHSPFTPHVPRTIPLTRHDFVGMDFARTRRQNEARITATVLDLEREMPKIRAYAFQRWSEAQASLQPQATRAIQTAYTEAFWDWAVLELLVQSGVRIEEACALTTLDILKRQLPDGQVYYLLHIKPSKYDRARVIPIGDGLGRVIAEICRHVKRFYGTPVVPFCDHWSHNEKRNLPPAPYLLQGMKHPSAISVTTLRERLRQLSRAAGARKADGSPLVLLPHDCRRVFASEHLNNNTPIHVIQALLGHATIDTVMIYAKLYPNQLIEEYRKAVRGSYIAFHGEESVRNPTPEEWRAFAASCSLRDMGTHLCALPTGEHCPKGLVCLGCVHAQPKQSAVPVFRRMLGSHERELAAGRERGEPAGQIAARDLEVARIRSALRRAEELTADVAAMLEAVH